MIVIFAPEVCVGQTGLTNIPTSAVASDAMQLKELVALKAEYQGPQHGSPSIVLIEDAHGLEEAQEHIERALIHFIHREKIDLVALEGGVGKADHSFFRALPDETAKRNAVSHYLSLAEISGGEAAAILSSGEILFYGLESKELYQQDRRSFLSALIQKGNNLEHIHRLEKQLDQASKRLFLPELSRLIAKERALDEGRLSLADWTYFLISRAGAQKIDLTDRFPSLDLIAKAMDQVAGGKMQKNALETELKNLSGEILFRETEDLSALLRSRFILKDNARMVLSLYSHLRLIKRLAGLELSPEDWKRLQEVGDLASLSRAYLQFMIREKAGEDIGWELGPAWEFYKGASKRDGILVENLLKVLKATGRLKAAVVVGGFHSDSFAEQLKKQGISYRVYSPVIRNLKAKNRYLDVMQGNTSYRSRVSSNAIQTPLITMGLAPTEDQNDFMRDYVLTSIHIMEGSIRQKFKGISQKRPLTFDAIRRQVYQWAGEVEKNSQTNAVIIYRTASPVIDRLRWEIGQEAEVHEQTDRTPAVLERKVSGLSMGQDQSNDQAVKIKYYISRAVSLTLSSTTVSIVGFFLSRFYTQTYGLPWRTLTSDMIITNPFSWALVALPALGLAVVTPFFAVVGFNWVHRELSHMKIGSHAFFDMKRWVYYADSIGAEASNLYLKQPYFTVLGSVFFLFSVFLGYFWGAWFGFLTYLVLFYESNSLIKSRIPKAWQHYVASDLHFQSDFVSKRMMDDLLMNPWAASVVLEHAFSGEQSFKATEKLLIDYSGLKNGAANSYEQAFRNLLQNVARSRIAPKIFSFLYPSKTPDLYIDWTRPPQDLSEEGRIRLLGFLMSYSDLSPVLNRVPFDDWNPKVRTLFEEGFDLKSQAAPLAEWADMWAKAKKRSKGMSLGMSATQLSEMIETPQESKMDRIEAKSLGTSAGERFRKAQAKDPQAMAKAIRAMMLKVESILPDPNEGTSVSILGRYKDIKDISSGTIQAMFNRAGLRRDNDAPLLALTILFRPEEADLKADLDNKIKGLATQIRSQIAKRTVLRKEELANYERLARKIQRAGGESVFILGPKDDAGLSLKKVMRTGPEAPFDEVDLLSDLMMKIAVAFAQAKGMELDRFLDRIQNDLGFMVVRNDGGIQIVFHLEIFLDKLIEIQEALSMTARAA